MEEQSQGGEEEVCITSRTDSTIQVTKTSGPNALFSLLPHNAHKAATIDDDG
jgi:hypothetical protein